MPGTIEGVVVSVNEAGNLVTDISADQLKNVPRDESVTVTCEDHVTNGVFTPDHNEPSSTLLALIGSNGQLEMTIVGENLSIMLGIGVGQKVLVRW